jgi:hypothetical protein
MTKGRMRAEGERAEGEKGGRGVRGQKMVGEGGRKRSRSGKGRKYSEIEERRG